MSDPRPPKSPRKGKYVNIRIGFLNDTVHVFQVPVKGVGSLLWDAVVNHLQLLEADYFDLEYTNQNGDDCWLDKDKLVLKQIGSPDTPLRFCVKFYTPDPGLLEDELTRYLFALQVRKDLLRGELRCSENTAALLASYIVQAEIGDFDLEECPDPTYLAVFKFVPEHLQSHQFMAKVMDYHKQHIGESPSEADLNLLDTARKVELYGIKMQTAKDHEGVCLNLAVAHLGVLVFQQYTKINTFSWAKVRKLSFKRKKFLIKLHADTYEHGLDGLPHTPTKSSRGYYKDTVEFFFDTRDRCKLFWKRCIEHHAFFRCQVVAKVPRNKTRVVSRGSSFRYCGRTQKQLVEYVRENIGRRPHFERSTSGRISSRSTSVTPKISSKPGMHSSSADLHTSSGSRSSGSHILDSNHTPGSGILRDSSGTPHSAMRVESVDVHSDSSMSGSRSLNSPRLEHGLSIDQDVIEAVNARTEGAMTDDEDNDEDLKSGSCVTPGISHVSSETKGAHSLLSPELNSPVRYVGLYSEVGSPECIQGDEVMSPEVDIVDKVVAPEVDIVDKVVAPVDTSRQVLASPAEVVGVSFTTDEGNAKMNISDDSVYSGDSSGHVSHTTSRPHLDLKLTNITSNLSSSVNVIHNLPESSSPLPTSSTPVPPSTHLDTASSSITTSASRTDTISSSPGTLPVSTSLSASQNVSSKPIRILKSKFIEDLGSRHPNTHLVDRKTDSGSKKVSSSIVGHHTETKLDDLSPPFPSPPPPLSSQYMEDHGKRALDASPSSCVTDTALSRQDSKVRLTSRVPSLDSNRSSPVTEKVSSFPLSTESKKKKTPLNMTSESPGDKVESEKTVKQKAPKQGNEEGSNKPKEVPHKKFPNGDVVGAGAPVKEHLEAEQGPNRKLSAGTDLIEDIPYILHRRLEGHKEETAIFKVSEADKLKRQRSLSPASKPASLTCVPSSESSERSRLTPDTRCLSPEVGEGHRGKPHSDKSPTLNRRIEFVNVHKLPSRNSYSSVDDTTSPSVEQDFLKQLEHGALSPEATKFSSPEKKWKPQGTINQKTEDHSDAASNKNYTKENMIGGTKETTEASITVNETLDSTERPTESKIDETKALFYQDNVKCSQSAQTSNVKEEVLVKKSINNETVSDEVQFYSPKIPGSQRLKNVITTSVSDDSPDAVVPEGEHILHETMKKPDQSFHLQFFEVSKPQPNLGRGTTESPIATKEVPKSLSLKSKQTDASDTSSVKPPTPTLPTEGQDSSSREITGEASLENKSVVKPKHRAPSLSATGRNSTSSTSSSDNNQFLIDLPSPAAALFYSDSDSPPPSQSRVNSGLSPLTFSTFRPDPAEETLLKVEEISKDKPKTNRWSLQSVEEAEEATDYKVIMSEGVVEKSALKKRTEDSDKPKEPKRVSWHEDSELQHSYHSDVSMTAQRSPVEECETALFGEGAALVDSGDMLETLEHLRQQNSESDMTNSGSSMTSTDGSDEETQSNAKQVYMQYAAAKGISPSRTSVGECRRREVSPLETLEGFGSLDGSFSSRKYNAEEDYYKTKDSSPLEQLERLSGLRVDNFDDEGEADDEDDEPNFPPPPPIMDIPEEMMVSYEGDLPLPAPDIPPNAETEFKKSLVKSWQAKTNLDPMSSSDPAGDLSCTTSESESDFDSEVANEKLKKLSPSITEPEYSGRISGEMKKSALIDCRSKPSSQLKAQPPEVLPKPLDMQPAPHLVQKAQPQKQAPPPVMPKPKPPPSILQHRPAPIRQPQMGKGKHFDRSRHMSSSSSTSSSSEPHQPPPPSAPS